MSAKKPIRWTDYNLLISDSIADFVTTIWAESPFSPFLGIFTPWRKSQVFECICYSLSEKQNVPAVSRLRFWSGPGSDTDYLRELGHVTLNSPDTSFSCVKNTNKKPLDGLEGRGLLTTPTIPTVPLPRVVLEGTLGSPSGAAAGDSRDPGTARAVRQSPPSSPRHSYLTDCLPYHCNTSFPRRMVSKTENRTRNVYGFGLVVCKLQVQ